MLLTSEQIELNWSRLHSLTGLMYDRTPAFTRMMEMVEVSLKLASGPEGEPGGLVAAVLSACAHLFNARAGEFCLPRDSVIAVVVGAAVTPGVLQRHGVAMSEVELKACEQLDFSDMTSVRRVIATLAVST